MMRILTFILFLLFVAASVEAADPPPASAYGRLPNVESMVISPNGQRIAFIAGNTREERSVVIYSLTGEAPNRIPLNGERGVDVQWLSNDRVAVDIYQYIERPGGERSTYNDVRRLIMNVDGAKPVEVRPSVRPSNLLLDDPENVILVAGTIELDERARSSTNLYERVDVYKYNILTGRAKRIHAGRQGTTGWVLYPNGEPAIRIDQDTDTDLGDAFRLEAKRTTYYANTGNGWKRIRDIRNEEDPVNYISVAGFREGEDGVYVTGRQNDADKVGLYKMSLETGEVTGPLFEPENNDLGGVLVDPYSRYIAGYVWTEGERKWVWWDEELGAIHAQMQNTFRGAEVSLQSWDQSRQRFIVSANGGPVAHNYYLFDRATNQLRLIAKAYPEVPDEQVNPVSYVEYEARDGTPIMAYLTLPHDREAKNLPLMVHPHGGPESRDGPDFEFWRQFLASRGYAVVQPQFRHSSGFGRAFARLGYGKWGQEMQTDLSDAIRFLADEGVVDPERVCIFGWSYGGYAALAGATITPEDYVCAVAGAPVSDLPRMLKWVDDYRGKNSSAADYWNRAIGSRFSSTDDLKKYSPARRVDQVRAPIMLIHGDIDLVVPIEQSEIMAGALQAAGKPYEFVRLEGENHNILIGETRIEMMEALERFVMEHNPPN